MNHETNPHKPAKTMNEVIQNVMQNYTIYIVSFKEVTLTGSNIIAPRIGICAPDINVMTGTTLDTEGRGCHDNKGLGGGIRGAFCGGTGGSHGGAGGYGMENTLNKNHQGNCTTHYPKPYYFGKEARYEGSAGATGVLGHQAGGNGGGIIWLSSTGTLTV
jgi:hypothetical protein